MENTKASTVSGTIKKIWTQKGLLYNTIKADVHGQYAGTALGLLWVVLGPILLLFLYSMIYVVIFRVRIPDYTVQEYVLNVFSGLVPFLAFATGLSMSASVVRSQRKLFFSNYPAEFIPIKAVCVAYVMLIVGTVLVIIGDFAVSKPSFMLLLVPVIAICQLLFSIGLGMVLAVLGLVVKDIEFLIQYTVIALLVVTPIAYTPEMIPNGLRPLLYMNPLFYFVSANQYVVLLNTLPPTLVIVVGLTLTFGMFFGGIWFFGRVRQVVNDLI